MKLDTRFAAMMALAAALAAPVFAQQGPQMTPEQRAARFDAADTSKDGKLDKAEFTASVPEQMKDRADQIFTMRDADKDGSITKAEYTAPMQRPQ